GGLRRTRRGYAAPMRQYQDSLSPGSFDGDGRSYRVIGGTSVTRERQDLASTASPFERTALILRVALIGCLARVGVTRTHLPLAVSVGRWYTFIHRNALFEEWTLGARWLVPNERHLLNLRFF